MTYTKPELTLSGRSLGSIQASSNNKEVRTCKDAGGSGTTASSAGAYDMDV